MTTRQSSQSAETPTPRKLRTPISIAAVGNQLLNVVKSKPYSPELRDQHCVYTRLLDHLDDIECQYYNWRKFGRHVAVCAVFCGLTSFLVCSLAVKPANRWRFLRLRIWQWVSMAIMLFGGFSVVPCLTCLLSWVIMVFFDRTHKHMVYFLRKMKRSVDITIWFSLVLLGWYAWFRPRLKHVHGDVSAIASQQITRALISACVGSVLWALKNALYYKLKADLHYDQLFDRIRLTLVYFNAYWILENRNRNQSQNETSFLVYEKETLHFRGVFEQERSMRRKVWLKVKYVVKRRWNKWTRLFRKRKTTSADPELRRNIWIDLLEMKRENVPIWILKRLSKEYLRKVKSIRPENADDLVNHEQEILTEAKKMFKRITDKDEKDDINQTDEIEQRHIDKYKLHPLEVDYIFRLKLYEEKDDRQGDITETRKHLEYYDLETEVQQQDKSTEEKQASDHKKTSNRTIEVDKFLNRAVRAHKNCWSLERTLQSSKLAFVKLNRMLSTFLIVLIVIIWLLISRIVNTAQLALLFAPFLAASFMFENSSKNMFQGIIFAFAMHPFDVGDRVIIEDMQMRVKEVHILTSVFYKYDTGAEVIFPNSKLATTKIVNLDITPDQSDKLDFLIDGAEIPLENIRDLELKIQKLLDDDLHYASGTKVVKCRTNNDQRPEELRMTVHFKYLVSYLPAEKKAERRSQILAQILTFRNEMMGEIMIQFPLKYIPYNFEFTTTRKKLVSLREIDHLKCDISARLQKGYTYSKVVMAHLENNKMVMAVYVSKLNAESEKNLKEKQEKQKQEEEKKVDKVQRLEENDLEKEENIISQLENDKEFFKWVVSRLKQDECSALKVSRDDEIIYEEAKEDPSPRNAAPNSDNPPATKDKSTQTSEETRCGSTSYCCFNPCTTNP